MWSLNLISITSVYQKANRNSSNLSICPERRSRLKLLEGKTHITVAVISVPVLTTTYKFSMNIQKRFNIWLMGQFTVLQPNPPCRFNLKVKYCSRFCGQRRGFKCNKQIMWVTMVPVLVVIFRERHSIFLPYHATYDYSSAINSMYLELNGLIYLVLMANTQAPGPPCFTYISKIS